MQSPLPNLHTNANALIPYTYYRLYSIPNPTFLVNSDIFIPKCTEGGEGGPPVAAHILKLTGKASSSLLTHILLSIVKFIGQQYLELFSRPMVQISPLSDWLKLTF